MAKNKNLAFLITLLFGILILNLFLGGKLVSAAATTYCAETTVSLPNVGVLHCLDGLSLSEVNQNYLYTANVSCESTEYCRTGTCVNTITGTCLSAGQATCSSDEGGEFYTTPIESTPRCQNGCCFLGDQNSFTTDAGCGVLASYAGITKNFDPSINSESACISKARPQERGACVYETSNGRTCDFTTRQNCQNLGTATGTFHAGFLCTNPTLGTNCVKSTQTTCLKTSSQVFFVDTCGNPANVYDSNKVDDLNYWSYLAGSDVGIANGVTVDLGDYAGNIGSATNGNCNYGLGSICMPYDRSIDPIVVGLLGDNICRSVNCDVGTFAELFKNAYGNGRTPYNGETWCGEATSNSITLTGGNPGVSSTDFSSYSKSGNLPGSTEVLFTCANGRITTEVNAAYRSKVCSQTIDAGGYVGAAWDVNRWQNCSSQKGKANCLDPDIGGDCHWITGVSALKDTSGTPLVWDETQDLLVPREDTKNIFGGKDFDTRQEASCVPTYPPGFDSSISQTDLSSQNICNLGSRICYVNYSAGLNSDWYVVNYAGDLFGGKITCLDDDEELVSGWVTNVSNLCMSLGDCGISVNYINTGGSNTQKDIFSIVKGNSSGILK